MLFYRGERFSIEGTQDAEVSFQDVQNQANESCKVQLLRLIERLADFGKLHSPDQFNHKTDGIFAIKTRCDLRAYGWYHSQRRSVFVISHFIVKKKQKLNPIDIERALRNKAQYEGEHMTLSFIDEWVNASPERRRLYAQEGLILSVTEEIWTALKRRGWQKQDLAKALGCSNAHVTQLLNGSRNMTLKTLSDIAEALNQQITISLEDKSKPKAWQHMEEPVIQQAVCAGMHIQPVRPQILVHPEEIKEVPFSETSTTVGIMILPYFTLGITILPYLRTGNT